LAKISYAYIEKNKWHLIEVIAVFLLGISKFMIGDLMDSKFYFITTGIIFWVGFIILRCSLEPALLEKWGFTSQNVLKSLRIIVPITLISVSGCILYGKFFANPVINWNLLIVFILYPLWGVIQQFLITVLLVGNLDRITRGILPRYLIVLTGAIIFALVHLPEIQLVLITFFMGIITISIFLTYGNIWTIGFFHGWFATFIYYFGLGRDPLREILLSL